jgi:hypothetical protein
MSKEMRNIYTIEYYSAIKKNEIVLFAGKYMELQTIMLREISQVQKDRGGVWTLISHMQNLEIYICTHTYVYICIYV